jgi:hypothetical protein
MGGGRARLQGEARTAVEGRARMWEGRARLRGGMHGYWGAPTHVDRARTPAGGRARLWGGCTLGWRRAHSGGRASTGVGRARTPVKGHAMVVEGTLRRKASIHKRSFLLNYTQSE